MINTLPKPVLIALLYRLSILHLASRILPTIGADTWESEDVDDESTDCPVRIYIGVCIVLPEVIYRRRCSLVYF